MFLFMHRQLLALQRAGTETLDDALAQILTRIDESEQNVFSCGIYQEVGDGRGWHGMARRARQGRNINDVK